MPKSIKIFLASSAELKSDREKFEQFIARKNKTLHRNGHFIELVIWEDFIDAMSKTRLQDEYNKVVRDCDIFVMLFASRVGKFTREEFESAFGAFKKSGRPRIYTFFKTAPVQLSREQRRNIASVFEFQDRLEQLGHFWKEYQNEDSLINQFNRQLELLDLFPLAAGKQTKEALRRDISVAGDADSGVVVSGDNNTITYIINEYYRQNTKRGRDADLPDKISAYLQTMAERYGKIELRGIKRDGEQVLGLSLDEVYVPLQAQAFKKHTKPEAVERQNMEAQRYPVTLDQLLAEGKQLIITGGPGCGKTTVLLHLAWVLARAIHENKPELAREKLHLDGALPLPILIPLNGFAAYLRKLQRSSSAKKRTLAAYLTFSLTESQTALDLPSDFFERLIKQGRSVMLLLDGLDEVANESERARVREAIEQLVDGREELRVVATCRTAAYRDRSTLGRSFRELQVQALEQEHIEQLIANAYRHIYPASPKQAAGKADELISGIARLEEQRRIRFGDAAERLVTTPLMIRLLLVVHYSNRRLPDQRAELYLQACDGMLLPDHTLDEAASSDISRLVGKDEKEHRAVVQQLAWCMHNKGQELGRNIDEADLRTELTDQGVDAKIIESLIDVTRQRGTLLEERLQNYRFIHLGFQEYLVAEYLAEVLRGESGIQGLAEFLEEGPVTDSWWREPILLTAGYLNIRAPQNARHFLQRLASVDKSAGTRSAPNPEIALASANLAGLAFLDWQLDDSDLKGHLAGRLADLLNKPAEPALANLRIEAGRTLAQLGDQREEITTVSGLAFCSIPAGKFMMGSEEEGREKPLHSVKISRAFKLGKYPVTQVQWREIMGESPSHFKGDNLPVETVSWEDVQKFIGKLNKAAGREAYRLPTEAEWEYACRAGTTTPFHTGENLTTDQANYNGNYPYREFPKGEYRQQTTPVGSFAPNAWGLCDMHGNVWEWCSDWYEKSYYQQFAEKIAVDPQGPVNGSYRVIRGGSWYYYAVNCRSAYRINWLPGYRYNFVGFRLVFVP